MYSAEKLYPPAPRGVPDDLTRPTGAYRLRVGLTIASIAVFLAVYAALVGASGYAVWWAATDDLANAYARIIVLAIGGLVLLFLIKFLFKRQRRDRSELIEINREDEPRLFDFIERLVAETGAPFPKRVYVTSDVNAAVFYDSSIFSLIFPVRKNLLIGLGVVNLLNLTELKAVLAHEFGHFSQRSMRIGSYVYVANHAIADMIWNRDKWDEFLAGFNRQDFRIAWIGWIVTAMTWVIRQGLGLIFRVINIAYASLSRQMEFSADKMAVRVTGSDALCHALVKLELADACMDQTILDVQDAADHGKRTRDIFYHQKRAVDYLRRRLNKPEMGVPPALPDDRSQRVQVFDANSDTHPSMWASHPRDYEREQNCKAVYIRSDVDDRSAWELFVDPRRVRERVTDQLWRQRVGHTGALHPAADVQRFIDDERAELLHDERYGGYYEGRTLYVGDHAAVFEQVRLESANTAQTRGEYETLYDQAFSRQAAAGRHLKEEFSKLLRTLQSGEKIRNLSFRGAKHQVEDIDHIMEVLGGELDEFSAWEDEHDTAVLRVHAQMASDLGDESWLDELEHRYQFQTVIQQTLREAGEAKQLLASGLEPLGKGELDEMEAQMVYETLRAVRQQLAEIMERAGRTRIPALTNFESTKLGEFLLVDPLVHDLYAIDGLTGDWINQLASQGQQLEDRARRLAGKGVGGILACQEAIAALWTSTHSDEGAESVA